ncbi:hypothetical protein MATL_G00026360 [Megalops atlanticus]|uniref:Uncharacterized protein n=1 Tax=Megalops atlanticus TaxID=7932 RepID=A0A9D3QC03_MEGAT|nr:hypothetical protein MATL_G00026360 [Megalops atlanticus]
MNPPGANLTSSPAGPPPLDSVARRIRRPHRPEERTQVTACDPRPSCPEHSQCLQRQSEDRPREPAAALLSHASRG